MTKIVITVSDAVVYELQSAIRDSETALEIQLDASGFVIHGKLEEVRISA